MKVKASLGIACWTLLTASLVGVPISSRGQTYVYLTGTPDYDWYAGCFGTASGNLAGFWDRHGLPEFYTGPTGGGVAPLDSTGSNVSIRSLWASKAGVDGRPSNKPGHIDDYYAGYEYTGLDPFAPAGRLEHTPDCTGDFIGLNQNKWTNLNSECRGNIDGYSFVFWDKTGRRRTNYYATNSAGVYIPDIASGLKQWARYRGYDADVFTQLTDFNSERSTTNGFTYEDVRREILAGYPVLCFLQPTLQFSRNLGGVSGVNPDIHGVMIYGLFSDPESGPTNAVLVRTSWALEHPPQLWNNLSGWVGLPSVAGPFALRGVIGFHPKPKVRSVSRGSGTITLTWDGPSAQLYDAIADTFTDLHRYTVQRATSLNPPNWKSVGTVTTARTATVIETGAAMAFYRVALLPNP